MLRNLLIAGTAVAGLLLAGCVFVVNPEGEDGFDAHWASDFDYDDEVRHRGSNMSLAGLVTEEYEFDEVLRDEKIRITARDDVVTLHGTVTSVETFDRAVQVAIGTEGVSTVVSRLTVRVRK